MKGNQRVHSFGIYTKYQVEIRLCLIEEENNKHLRSGLCHRFLIAQIFY